MLSREEVIKAFGIQRGYTTAFWGPNDMQAAYNEPEPPLDI